MTMSGFLEAHLLLMRLGCSQTRITRREFEPISGVQTRITDAALTLQVLGFHTLADRCLELSGALSNKKVLDATIALNAVIHDQADDWQSREAATSRFDRAAKALTTAQAKFMDEIQVALRELNQKSAD